MHVGNNFKWSSQVDAIAKKVSSGLFAVRRIFRIGPQDMALSVCYALVQSHLMYRMVL